MRFIPFDKFHNKQQQHYYYTPTNSSRHDLQIIKKKIETGQHYFTKEELDAIWWDGYEHGSLDSA